MTARDEELFFTMIENFPCMVFLKYGDKETRDDYDCGFRYAYFNYIMDIVSGFRRLDMIDRNAKDHFPVHYKRYFDDDQAVMELAAGDASAVREIFEPWNVATGNHVLHTRKANLQDRFMLGTFILTDDAHLGQVEERWSPIPSPLSPPPPKPKGTGDGFWAAVWDWLPVSVMVTFPAGEKDQQERPAPIKNQAFRSTFSTAHDAFFGSLDEVACEGMVYERSRVELSRPGSSSSSSSNKYHVLQRPLRVQVGPLQEEMLAVVYVVWPMPQPRGVS